MYKQKPRDTPEIVVPKGYDLLNLIDTDNGAIAKRLGMNYIGIDLNPKFCELARQRIEKVKTE